MVATAVREFGGLDILVNNAGVARIIPFLETTAQDWDVLFDINCKGVLWCSQAAARVMIEQGRGGEITNLGPHAGHRGVELGQGAIAGQAGLDTNAPDDGPATVPPHDQATPRDRRDSATPH